MLSYVVGFAALAVLLLPSLGGWGIILSLGGVSIALPSRAVAAPALLRRRETRSHSRFALTIEPTRRPRN
ncbi:hypothetical protein [Methylorubrum thiocyanatum]|uniref:F0F1-type ATP synthase assembly protein I n=1 Tax=Methylorubrum thiocyanatum TaxID=47958 RepID=A0AA40VAZ0_9HYPH|nr:hypothetical protein [Methylorubrum thiocyanatum]MBA8911897.1 F0F1-type ATP synthase assembly protein I [Methylorubrum thiocyanatum]